LLPINYSDVEEVTELVSRNTQRGAGGFGSTGL
jgi:dUTPase